jgi:hypothetical protein
LNVLIFLFLFGQSWPEWLGIILLDQGEKQMEPSLGPFGLLFVDLFTKFQSKSIFFLVAFSFE